MARKRKVRGRRDAYDTYLFKDKDPVIDILRTLIVDNARHENETLTKIIARVAEESGTVSYSTLRGWFFGDTKRPQHATIEAVARFYGKTFNELTDLAAHLRRQEARERRAKLRVVR